MHLCLMGKYCILILYEILNSENCKHELCKIKHNKKLFSHFYFQYSKKFSTKTSSVPHWLKCALKNNARISAAWKPLIKAQILKRYTCLISNFGLYISGDSLGKTIVIVLELLGYCYPVKNMGKTEKWSSS